MLADAAGRRRPGEDPGAAPRLHGDQYPLGREAREIAQWPATTSRRDIVGRPGRANIAGRDRNVALRFTGDERDRHRSPRRPQAGILRRRWVDKTAGAHHPVQAAVYERVVQEFAALQPDELEPIRSC
jgi:hypothetical protein